MAVSKTGKKSTVIRSRDVGVYDAKLLNEWEYEVNSSAEHLNEYVNRRKNNEWMSEDELDEYRTSIEAYKTGSEKLLRLKKSSGNYGEKDELSEKERAEYISYMSSDLDDMRDYYSRWDNAEEYNEDQEDRDEQKRLENLYKSENLGELKKQIDNYSFYNKELKDKIDNYSSYNKELKDKIDYYNTQQDNVNNLRQKIFELEQEISANSYAATFGGENEKAKQNERKKLLASWKETLEEETSNNYGGKAAELQKQYDDGLSSLQKQYDDGLSSLQKRYDDATTYFKNKAETDRLYSMDFVEQSNEIAYYEGLKGLQEDLADVERAIDNGKSYGWFVTDEQVKNEGWSGDIRDPRLEEYRSRAVDHYKASLYGKREEIVQSLRDAGFDISVDRGDQPTGDDDIFYYGELQKTIDNQLSSLNKDYRNAKRLQTTQAFYDLAENDDFVEKSQYDPAVESESGIYEEINTATDLEGRDYMSKFETRLFNYIYATQGEEKATEFYDLIEETRNQREGEEDYEDVNEDGWWHELLFLAYTMPERFYEKASAIFSDDEWMPRAAIDFSTEMVKQDLNNTGPMVTDDKSLLGVIGDTIVTTTDMIPSILAGTATTVATGGNVVAGAAVTSALFGAGAYGDDYRQTLNQGYSKEEADNYATLVGVSEAGLSMLLSGVYKGSGASMLINKLTSGIKSAGLKVVSGVGGRMLSEFTEESLQEVLDPLFQNIALHADNSWDDIDWDNVLYAGILGALSSFILDGGRTAIGNTVSNVRAGNVVKKSGQTNNLINFSNALSADTVAHKLAGKITENTGAYKIGKLLREAGAESLSATNMADIVSALEAKGVAPEHANTIAEWMNNTVMGVELTEQQQMALDSNPVIAQVYNEVLLDSKSTVNQRMTGYKQLVNDVNRGNALAQKRKKIDKTVEKAIKDKYDEQAQEVKNKVSDEGKTMVDGTEVTLKGLDHIEVVKDKDGKITDRVGYVKVVDANGNESVVKSTDVEFSTRTEAVLYDAFVSMDIDPKYFDAFVKNFNEADFDGNLGEAAIQYALGFRNAYRYGWINEQTKVADDVFASKLNESVRNIAYKLGKESIETKTETNQKALDTAVNERKESGKGKVRTRGKLHMEGVKSKTRTALQKAGIGLARRLTNLGMDVYLFESHKNDDGDWVDDRGELVDNGFYRASDGSIHIDINAGQRDVSIMAFTLSHELVHFMRDNAPREFKILADLLIEWYGKKGVSVNKQIEEIMDSESVDWDTAYEEFVAKSCESFLTDSNIADRILELKNKDEKTHGIVREKVLKFLNWMKSLFRNVDVESEQGAFVRKFQKEIDHLYDAFYNALASASETFQWAGSRDISTFEGANTTDGDITFADVEVKHSRRYWYPNMSAAEISYVRSIAKNEVQKTDKFIDNGNKWLYNTKNGTPYFALYSTADVNDPTVMYACKGNRANKENAWFMDFINELETVENGRDDLRRKTIDEVLASFGYALGKSGIHSGNATNGRSSQNVGVHSSTSGFRPSAALLICLRNIAETPKEEQRGGVKKSTRKGINMEVAVEQTKDLVAMHNISPAKLLESLKQGGLVMPSIAITNKGLNKFAELSILFDKTTIDPDVDSNNKLYGADAWTPQEANIKKNAKFDTNKTVKAVNGIKNTLGYKFAPQLFNVTAKQFRDTILANDGSLVASYNYDIGVQTAYALENGLIDTIPTKKDGSVNEDALQEMLDSKFGVEATWSQYRKWLNDISDTIIKSYDKATNEDVLNSMKKQPDTAKPFKLSVSGELVVPVVQYQSVDGLRRIKGRLSTYAESANKAVANEMLSWAKSVAESRGIPVEKVVKAINSTFYVRYDRASIMTALKSNGVDVSSKQAADLQSLYKQAVELPTEYFESKPHRNVGINEIKAVVMPSQESYDGDLSELRGELEKCGIEVIEYEAGNKESRVNAINSRDDIKFSKRQKTPALRGGHFEVAQYTEEQYNAFGWASYSGVITANERETLLSRFADFKHNRNKYPVTRGDEAVIHSTECPDVIMYVKGSIESPNVTRIVRIKADDGADVSAIQERIVANEFEQKPFPYESIESYYGEEYLEFHRKRDYASFRQYQDSLEEGRGSQESHSVGEGFQDGRRSLRSGVEGNRADDSRIKKSTRHGSERNLDETLEDYKEKAEQRLRNVIEHNMEVRKRNVESRKRTVVRNKIKRSVSQLNSILNHGTKERNVKTDLQDTVSASLRLSNVLFNDVISNEDIVKMGSKMATEEEQKLLDRYKELIEKRDSSPVDEALRYADRISNLNSRLSDLFKRERAQLNKESVSTAVDELAKAYETISKSDKEYVRVYYDKDVHERLKALSNTLKGTALKDMSLSQLEEVYQAYKMIHYIVSESNSLFRMGKKESLDKKVDSVQREILSYFKERKNDPAFVAKKVSDFIKGYGWNEMKPLTAFETVGSDSLTELFWDVIKAEGQWARQVDDGKQFLDEQRKKYGYKSWDMETAHEFTLPDGKAFRLTLQDMMSIYAYSKREQAQDHMTVGGFQFDEKNHYNQGRVKRSRLSDLYVADWATIGKVISELTDEQKKYVDAVQEYLTNLGKLGNKVSETLYGIGLFNESNYFPLKSSSDYLSSIEQALGKTETQVSLKNTGMTKQTVPGANNPIILQAFDDVVEGHVDEMAKYCNLALPIENLQRVFNSKSNNGGYESTQSVIHRVYGKGAVDYLNQYITDLNGGVIVTGAENPMLAMFTKFKGTAVGASLSVAIQQPMAIIRAMDVISPKYFILGKSGKTEAKHIYDEIKTYAPVAIIKEMGGFDVGSSRSAREYLGTRTDKGLKRAVDDMKDASMWLASKGDVLGWDVIWKAVKHEVNASGKYELGSKEFFEACGERFTEVIVRTQVYDSVNSRSGFMRSKHDSVKFATSFMGEPTTVVNQAYLGLLDVSRAKGKTAKLKAMRKLGRTFGVLVNSTIMTTISKSLIYAMRDDDDDDEALIERWAKQTGDNLLKDLNPATMLPYARDIVSLFEGWDVDRPDMVLIANAIQSVKRVLDEEATVDDLVTFLGDLSNMLGVPVKNVVRDVKAIFNTYGDITDGISPTDISGAFASGLSGEEKTTTEKLYDAIMSGDTAKIDVIKSGYKDESSYESALKKSLRENDPRVREALKIRVDQGTSGQYQKIRQDIIDDGKFEESVVNDALKAEYNYYKGKIEDAAELLKAGDKDGSDDIIRDLKNKYKGTFTQDDILTAVKRKAGLLR